MRNAAGCGGFNRIQSLWDATEIGLFSRWNRKLVRLEMNECVRVFLLYKNQSNKPTKKLYYSIAPSHGLLWCFALLCSKTLKICLEHLSSMILLSSSLKSTAIGLLLSPVH